MALSSDLLSQFAKITKDNSPVKKETTVYGTIVSYNGSNYVQLDGSDLLTPISSTTDANPGERVSVLIKNHTATVNGNVSSPAARTDDVKTVDGKVNDVIDQISTFEIVIAGKVDTAELNAEKARIDTLVSDNVTIHDKLTADEADISTLQADNVTINGKLTANEADIQSLQVNKLDVNAADIKFATIEGLTATNADIYSLNAAFGDFQVLSTNKFTAYDADISTLQTDKLSTTDADIRYANIDFTNIGSAAIEQFFSKSGMISNLVVGESTVTGTLVGVTIKGDSIEAGTVIADKLVVLGTDGIYYKLNTDGVNIEAEQTESNSLNGSIITANSITASKISVNDLVAFNATIGGFNITDSSIYSGVKESIHNTTAGIYLDDDGQIAFGDDSNFLKFYKDDAGNYKLQISAESILFSSGSNVETALNDLASSTQNLQNTVNTNQQNLETYIRFDTDGMELGKINSPFMAELSNQELAFLQNGNKVAYINDNKLYITDAEVVDSLKIGSFQYVPRANGNMSFKWIGGS